jgi:hypothetical protein
MLLKLEVPEYFLMLHTISSKVMPAGVGNSVLECDVVTVILFHEPSRLHSLRGRILA